MGKSKLQKFAEMEMNPLVIQCPFWKLHTNTDVTTVDGEDTTKATFNLKGKWHSDFFHNSNPIVLELGCGRGEYTTGLARRFHDKNFIGVDIKGSRMWHGAREALNEGMKNVAFLRTNIECIDSLFAKGEVAEIWLTFSDPQMKKATKRLTSTFFMERYRHFLADNGTIHVKTDSNFLATYTYYMATVNKLPLRAYMTDLYHMETVEKSADAERHEILIQTESDEYKALTEIQTYYEHLWLERGIPIKYLQFLLPHYAELREPDIEIPVDGYRSYNHEVRSTRKTSK